MKEPGYPFYADQFDMGEFLTLMNVENHSSYRFELPIEYVMIEPDDIEGFYSFDGYYSYECSLSLPLDRMEVGQSYYITIRINGQNISSNPFIYLG